MENKQSRWKSIPMWTGIISGLLLVYNSIANEFNLPTIENQLVNTIIQSLASILVGFGIINNPTDKNNL